VTAAGGARGGLDDVVLRIAHDRERTERLLAELIETPSVRGEPTEIARDVVVCFTMHQ
jgi:hypothetical protein